MRTRVVCGFGVVVALGLAVASALAASPGWKRYTFPAAPPDKVVSPGMMTVQFPVAWRVKTTWGTLDAPNGAPNAYYGRSWSGPSWWANPSFLEETSTTISDIRDRMLGWAGTHMWGEGTPLKVYVGDSYVTLPMGKVWRLTLALVPQKGQTKFKLSYQRDYVLDRGVVMTTAGVAKRLFVVFTVTCSAQVCKTHNGELAAIMRSIRITP